jgi:hypothetical protein
MRRLLEELNTTSKIFADAAARNFDTRHGARRNRLSAWICDRQATKSWVKRPAARRVVGKRLAGFVARSSQIHVDMLVAPASPASLLPTTASAKIFDVVFKSLQLNFLTFAKVCYLPCKEENASEPMDT